MNQSTYRISLDIHSVASQLSFSINRGDNMRRLIITLTENGKTYEITKDCYAIFTTVKPDGNSIANDCTIQNNTIIYDFTEQTTAVAGKLDCSVVVFNTKNERITSSRFTVIVYETTHQAINVASESEYTILTSQIAEAATAIEEMVDITNTVKAERDSGAYNGKDGVDGVSIVNVDVYEQSGGQAGTQYALDVSLSNGEKVYNTFIAPRGEKGVGVPDGGRQGQVLTKDTDAEGSAVWADVPSGGGAYTDHYLVWEEGFNAGYEYDGEGNMVYLKEYYILVPKGYDEYIFYDPNYGYATIDISKGQTSYGFSYVGIYGLQLVEYGDIDSYAETDVWYLKDNFYAFRATLYGTEQNGVYTKSNPLRVTMKKN